MDRGPAGNHSWFGLSIPESSVEVERSEYHVGLPSPGFGSFMHRHWLSFVIERLRDGSLSCCVEHDKAAMPAYHIPSSLQLHFSLDQQEIFERAHGNPNWPNQNNGNGNGPSGNGKGNGNGYGVTQPEMPAGVACTATDNCVIPSQNSPISYHGGPTLFLTQKFPKITRQVLVATEKFPEFVRRHKKGA